MTRMAISLALALFLGAIVAGPATAGVVIPGEYGSAVKCKYRVTEYVEGLWNKAILRTMVVIPPVMVATEDGNKVGWRFLIKRSTENGPYVRVYRSTTQKRVATTYAPADFEARHVRIALPDVEHPNLVRYRATLVMLHYNADGSLNTRTTHTLTNIISTFDGNRYDQEHTFCKGTASNSD